MSALNTRVLILEEDTKVVETSLERFLDDHSDLTMSDVLKIQTVLEAGEVFKGERFTVAEVEAPATPRDRSGGGCG